MKNIVEVLGETTTEIVGAVVVFASLAGALVLLRNFGDFFIGHFM